MDLAFTAREQAFRDECASWFGQTFNVLENGKKQQRYFKTEKEARLALRKMLNEKEQGILLTGPEQTLKALKEDSEWARQTLIAAKSQLRAQA